MMQATTATTQETAAAHETAAAQAGYRESRVHHKRSFALIAIAGEKKEATKAMRLATEARKLAAARVQECSALHAQLQEAAKENQALQADAAAKEQQLKVARARGDGGRREALRKEALTKEIDRCKHDLQGMREASQELKTAWSLTKKHLRVEKDKVAGLDRRCRIQEQALKDLQSKVEFYSKEADGTEEDEDVAEHSPWLYERSLRKDCCDAVAEGQALFAIATKLQVRLSHEVDKSKELEKLMDQQKHNLNNLPIRKEDDRRKVANWVPTPYPNPQHQTKHSTNPNPN